MKEIRCPYCKKLLMKANFVNAEIMCKCGRLVKIRFFTSESLILTSEEKIDKVKIISKRSLNPTKRFTYKK